MDSAPRRTKGLHNLTHLVLIMDRCLEKEVTSACFYLSFGHKVGSRKINQGLGIAWFWQARAYKEACCAARTTTRHSIEKGGALVPFSHFNFDYPHANCSSLESAPVIKGSTVQSGPHCVAIRKSIAVDPGNLTRPPRDSDAGQVGRASVQSLDNWLYGLELFIAVFQKLWR